MTDIDALIDALGDSRWLIRARAVKSLASVRGAEATEALLAVLADEDEDVRLAAADALASRGPSAMAPLMDALVKGGIEVRWGAACVLGRIGDLRAMDSLTSALDDPEWRVRRAAARALGKVGDAGAVDPLTAALDDPSGSVRDAAAEGLSRVHARCGIAPLSSTGSGEGPAATALASSA
ncbi:MAG: hypothetical protein GF320_15030 [Armatimonadia bacterium]|nr:hypothetical protein [Armatimonadia bacterium]